MEAIDEMGLFWLAGHPDDALSGRLVFSPKGGAEGGIDLFLVGLFDRAAWDHRQNDLRIVGWIGTKQVTLDQAFLSASNEGSGVATSRYRANQLYIGHQFGRDESLEFQMATASFSDFDVWVNDQSTTEEYPSHQTPAPGKPVYTVSFDPPEREKARFSQGTVEMSIRWERTTDDRDSLVWRTWPAITIRYDHIQPMSVVRKDIGRIQDLVTLCLNKSTIMDRLLLTRPDVRARSLAGTDMGVDQPIELRVPLIRYVEPAKRKKQLEYRMLLTYDGLGRLDAVAKWLDASRTFQRSLDSLMSVRFAQQMYAENRYLNVTFASEAFHRISTQSEHATNEEFSKVVDACVAGAPEAHREWLHDRIAFANEPSLRKRMRQLAAKTKSCTRMLIGNVDDWAFVVSGVRNELTHVGRHSRDFSGGDLRRLSESVFLVTGVAMLIESGVSIETLAARAESDALTAEAGLLRETVRRVRQELLTPR
jgi:hypothetical protein